MWPEVPIELNVIPPPKRKKKRGRKPMDRRKEAEEIEQDAEINRKRKMSRTGKEVTCSICGGKGHNKRHHGAGSHSSTDANEIQEQFIDNDAPPVTQPTQVYIYFFIISYCFCILN